MTLKSCIIALMIAYPVFLAAGIWFYHYTQKIKPWPFPAGDQRNSAVWVIRFAFYIVLLPPGVTAALAVLGALDPLFHLVVNIRAG